MNWTWLITAASIIGVVANIHKRRWCYHIWTGTNAFWCALDWSMGLKAQAFLFLVYLCLSIWGLFKWRE